MGIYVDAGRWGVSWDMTTWELGCLEQDSHWSHDSSPAFSPQLDPPPAPPAHASALLIFTQGYFIAFSPIGQQGMTFERLDQDIDQIGNWALS